MSVFSEHRRTPDMPSDQALARTVRNKDYSNLSIPMFFLPMSCGGIHHNFR
jgi:hypothetical protein